MRFVLLLILDLFLMTTAANAEQTAQRWMTKGPIVVAPNSGLPAGAAAIGRIDVKDVSADIGFDPRNLDESFFVFSASFMPVALPGNRDIDENIKAQAAGSFTATKIEQKDDNLFHAIGQFRMNGRVQPLTLPLTVTFVKDVNQTPVISFRSQFLAPIGQMAPGFGLPTQVPMTLQIQAAAYP